MHREQFLTQVYIEPYVLRELRNTYRTRTRNLFRPKCAPIPLGHSDGKQFNIKLKERYNSRAQKETNTILPHPTQPYPFQPNLDHSIQVPNLTQPNLTHFNPTSITQFKFLTSPNPTALNFTELLTQPNFPQLTSRAPPTPNPMQIICFCFVARRSFLNETEFPLLFASVCHLVKLQVRVQKIYFLL